MKNGHVEDIDFHPGISIDFHNKGGGTDFLERPNVEIYQQIFDFIFE